MRDKIIQLILNKVSEEAQQEQDKPTTVGVYRASAIGGCPRALQYSILQTKGETLTPETHLIFKDGHLHHNAVRELLAKVGTVSSIEMTVSKRYKYDGQSFIITGTLDLVFNNMVIDIKSMSTYRFKYLDRDWPKEYMNYLEQLMIYMDITGRKKGAILFKDKNTSELKIKYVDYAEDTMDSILTRVAEIHRLAKSKKLIERPYGRDTWHCKLCQYRLPCWKLPMEVRTWQRREG